jgi:DNA-binding transcriptional LysR family regulator
MAIDLHHLRYFVAVCEAGQVTSAARRLHLAQPALTRALHALEQEVGVALLERHPKGVTPTLAGAAFYRDARNALDALDAAMDRAREGAPGGRTLRLGSLSGGIPELDRRVLRFRREFPEIAVSWRAMAFNEELAAVVDGELDVTCFWTDYRAPPGVRIEPLAIVPVHLAVDVGSPLARLPVVRFEHFEDGVFAGQHPSVPDEFADVWYLTRMRGHRPRTARQTPLTVTEGWTLVAEGRILGVTPGPVRPNVAADLIALPRVVDVPPFTMSMAYREDNASPALAAFAASMRVSLGGVTLGLAGAA